MLRGGWKKNTELECEKEREGERERESKEGGGGGGVREKRQRKSTRGRRVREGTRKTHGALKYKRKTETEIVRQSERRMHG